MSQVAADTAGNVVVAGYTPGSLAGPNKGSTDAFVIKYASDGTEQWRRQLGTTGEDGAAGIATDAAGGVVVAGWTAGSLAGPNEGSLDAFIVKYASDGAEQWRRQLGSTVIDLVEGVAINDAGDVVIAGYTPGSLGGPNNGGWDVFVAAYSSDGRLLWTRQPGTTVDDWTYGVTIDAPTGNVILGWKTDDDLIGEVSFFSVYSASGTLLERRRCREARMMSILRSLQLTVRATFILPACFLRNRRTPSSSSPSMRRCRPDPAPAAQSRSNNKDTV